MQKSFILDNWQVSEYASVIICFSLTHNLALKCLWCKRKIKNEQKKQKQNKKSKDFKVWYTMENSVAILSDLLLIIQICLNCITPWQHFQCSWSSHKNRMWSFSFVLKEQMQTFPHLCYLVDDFTIASRRSFKQLFSYFLFW